LELWDCAILSTWCLRLYFANKHHREFVLLEVEMSIITA
jgi:hypothetical protein